MGRTNEKSINLRSDENQTLSVSLDTFKDECIVPVGATFSAIENIVAPAIILANLNDKLFIKFYFF